MAVAERRYEHILIDEDRVPRIAGTTIKVIELVLDQQVYGWSPEELHFQHPQLTLGQIHAALAYYFDHREELDRDIEQRFDRATQLQQTLPVSPLVTRLRAQGKS
ncbi:MAG TPA: DUF433 domain-containing protein [Herpetosiphonaceae bacterium]